MTTAVVGDALAAPGKAGRAQRGRATTKWARWHVTELPVRRHRPYSYAEPGITAGADGVLVADAATANTGVPPTFWVSRDGGRSWEVGRDFDPTGASTGDTDAAIGPDGYLYALNLGYGNPPGGPANPTVLVFRSRNGRRWSGPASFPPPHGLDQPDRPWLVINPRRPANVDVVNSEGGGAFVLWRSLNHGASFHGPYPVGGGANSQAALALSSRPLFDPTRAGRMFMIYDTASSTRAGGEHVPLYEFPMTQIWLATSTDDGVSWSNRRVLNTAMMHGPLRDATVGHLLIASGIDGRGRLYVAFSARAAGGTKTAIYLIHSTDHGMSWSRPAEAESPMASNVMPALAVTRAGTAYLSWYGSRNPNFRSSRAAWRELFAETVNPLARRPRFVVRRLSGPRPVHVGGIDVAGTIGQDTGANWGLRDFQSIVVGPCVLPHPVWADDNGRGATYTASPAVPCTP